MTEVLPAPVVRRRATGTLKPPVVAAVRVVGTALARAVLRLRVQGAEHVPTTGPVLLAGNHSGLLDGPLVYFFSPRPAVLLAKSEIFVGAWRRPLGWLGLVPVHRGTPDRDALKACERLLAAGQPLVIFPEGTCKSGPVVEEIFEGPAYLAAKLPVPVVPVGIGGREAAMPKGARMVRPVRIAIVVGEPLRPPAPTAGGRVGRSGVRVLSAQLKAELQRLFDEAQSLAGGR